MKVNTASTASAGVETGTKIRVRMRMWPHPSSLAASSSSLGTVMKNWRSRNVPNAVNAHGRISAWYELTQPSCFITRNIGITMTSCGTISVLRYSTNRPPRKRKLSRANAYPDRADATSVTEVPTAATKIVLRMNRPNGREFQASAKLPNWMLEPNGLGGTVKTSALGFSADSTIQMIGSMKSRAIRDNSVWDNT